MAKAACKWRGTHVSLESQRAKQVAGQSDQTVDKDTSGNHQQASR